MNDVIVSLTTKLQNLFRGVEQSMLVTAGLLLSLLLIECALVGWSKSSLRALLSNSMSAWVDIACAALVLSNVALLLGTVMTFGVVYALTAQIKAHISIGVLDYAGSPYVCYAVYIVALDFTNYWVHRWMHTDRRLWEIHRFHHEARDFTMLTTLRDHPMERVLLHSAGAIPSALLGMPPSHYLAAQLLLQSVGFLKHSNLDSDWGWFGRWVVQSPRAHRLHHSMEEAHHNKNFASLFQLWDVAFGTAMLPPRGAPIRIGLTDAPVREGLIRSLWRTSVAFYSAFSRKR